MYSTAVVVNTMCMHMKWVVVLVRVHIMGIKSLGRLQKHSLAHHTHTTYLLLCSTRLVEKSCTFYVHTDHTTLVCLDIAKKLALNVNCCQEPTEAEHQNASS